MKKDASTAHDGQNDIARKPFLPPWKQVSTKIRSSWTEAVANRIESAFTIGTIWSISERIGSPALVRAIVRAMNGRRNGAVTRLTTEGLYQGVRTGIIHPFDVRLEDFGVLVRAMAGEPAAQEDIESSNQCARLRSVYGVSGSPDRFNRKISGRDPDTCERIERDKLIDGTCYWGQSRLSKVAVWTGRDFATVAGREGTEGGDRQPAVRRLPYQNDSHGYGFQPMYRYESDDFLEFVPGREQIPSDALEEGWYGGFGRCAYWLGGEFYSVAPGFDFDWARPWGARSSFLSAHWGLRQVKFVPYLKVPDPEVVSLGVGFEGLFSTCVRYPFLRSYGVKAKRPKLG